MQDELERKCPFCAELVKVDAIKCKHCGEKVPTENPPVDDSKYNFIALVIFLVLFAVWVKKCALAEPEAKPAPPVGSVTYKGQVYLPWSTATNNDIERVIRSKSINCPNYKFRKEQHSSAYIVYCEFDYKGLKNTNAYMLFGGSGEAIGPFSPSNTFK